MSPRRHLSIALIFTLIVVVLGFFGLGFFILTYLNELPSVVQFIVMSGCGMVGFFIAKYFFTNCISATCPKCKSSTYPERNWISPVSYRCPTCGYYEVVQLGLSNDV